MSKKNKISPIKCSPPANISMGSFLRDYERGTVRIPSHQEYRAQKGGIWSEIKIKNWINLIVATASDTTITASEKILGHMIVTYRVESDTQRGPKYINDGAHRAIHSVKSYLDKIYPDPKSKNYKQQLKKWNQFNKYLDEVQITEQYKLYKNKRSVVDDFINLNTAGATGTAYEVLSARFTCEINQKRTQEFKDFLERVESSIPNKLIALGHSPTKVGSIVKEDNDKERRKKQKFMRDTRASFVSFANCNKLQCPYQGVSSIWLTETNSDSKLKSHVNIENDLLDFFNSSTPEEVSNKLKEWERFLDKIISIYDQVSNENYPLVKHGETSVRWWVFMCVYWKNIKADIDYRKFLEIWFKEYQGTTSFVYKKDGVNKKTTAQLQKFKGDVYEAFGFDRNLIEKTKIAENKKLQEKRKKNKFSPKVGYHNSHIKNFFENGEGETLLENSYENLKRGAKDMTQDEINRLRKLNRS